MVSLLSYGFRLWGHFFIRLRHVLLFTVWYCCLKVQGAILGRCLRL